MTDTNIREVPMDVFEVFLDGFGGFEVSMSNDKYDEIITLLENHQIPDEYPERTRSQEYPQFMNMELDNNSTYYRSRIIHNSCFPFLAKKWIEPLAKWIGRRKVLEVMAGSGALSKSLKECGVNIKPTDIYENDYFMSYDWGNKLWCDVEQISANDAIEKYGKEVDIIIMSWPPYQTSDAHDTLIKMREINPDCIMLYIGESQGGCTADDDFFTIAEFFEDPEFEEEVGSNYRSSYGIHDRLYIVG